MQKDSQKKPKLLFEFEKFNLYQRSVEFADRIYNTTKKFPRSKFNELISQLDRSALSISLNLTEGFSSYYKKEKKRYFRIARNSVNECVPALKLSLKQKLIKDIDYYDLYQECYEISCMISGLIKSVDKRLDG